MTGGGREWSHGYWVPVWLKVLAGVLMTVGVKVWSGGGDVRWKGPREAEYAGYLRSTPVREASSSSTVTWAESAETCAKQGIRVSGEVVQRGRSRGDAAGSVRS